MDEDNHGHNFYLGNFEILDERNAKKARRLLETWHSINVSSNKEEDKELRVFSRSFSMCLLYRRV